MEHFFYKVPNVWIRRRPPDTKRMCAYYLISYLRNLSDMGIFSLRYIIESCGYKCRAGADRVNNIYKSIIAEAIQQQDIILEKGYKYPPRLLTDALPYKINRDNFDVMTNFTKLTNTEFDTLIRNNPNRNKERLLGVYLYIKSYYHKSTSVNRPVGFYQTLQSIQKSIGCSRKTLIALLNELVERKLLYKHYTGSYEFKRGSNKVRENVPNIYIPILYQRKEDIEDVVSSTVKLIKEQYKVSSFLPFMENLKEN